MSSERVGGLSKSSKVQTLEDRYRNFESLLKPIIEEWTRARERETKSWRRSAHGVPAASINTVADVFKCAHTSPLPKVRKADLPPAGAGFRHGTGQACGDASAGQGPIRPTDMPLGIIDKS